MKDIQIRKLQEENKAHHEGNIFLSNLLIQERNEKRKLEAEFKAYIAEMEAYCDSLEAKIVELTTEGSNEARNTSEIEENSEPPSRKGRIIKNTIDDGVCIFDKGSMAKGKKGETKAAIVLSENGYDVYDMSDDKEYRKMDIDFVLDKDGVQTTLEVKSSASARYGTVWIEDILNIRKNKKGWIHYCKAEYLAAVGKGMMYFYKTDEMLDYVIKSKELKESGQANDLYNPTERIQDDPKFIGEQSLIYGVDMKSYANTGRFCTRIKTNGYFSGTNSIQ